MASTFGSNDPLSSTDDKCKNYRIYRRCGCVESLSLSKTSALKMQMIPPLLLPSPRAPLCCIFTLPLGEQIAFFFNRDCLTTTLIGACRAALSVYIEVGVVAPQERGHHHACRNFCWNWCEGISWWSTPPLLDGDDAADHGGMDGSRPTWLAANLGLPLRLLPPSW